MGTPKYRDDGFRYFHCYACPCGHKFDDQRPHAEWLDNQEAMRALDHRDGLRNVVAMVRELAREDAILHVPCGVCGLECCLGGPTCRCPLERVGVAISWLPGIYLHAGTCLSAFCEDPHCIGEAKFTDTRIN